MNTEFKILGHDINIAPTPPNGTLGKSKIAEGASILQKYKAAKKSLEDRIIENEKWFKLRHWDLVRKGESQTEIEPKSAWLFNTIMNKHADAMDNYPEPNVLPREQGDEEAAKSLSSILPVIFERNNFEETYSDAWWYKLKTGTSAYGVFWDKSLESGLGDIAIKKIDLLNLFWEPGITDIQDSRNVFVVSLVDDDILKAQYPQIKGSGNKTITVSEYVHDDAVDTSEKSLVVDWYYKVNVNGRNVLHYIKFVGDTELYSTMNDPEHPDYAERGLYDHGKYPIHLDVLFPVEDSPCGFSYIDLLKDDQMYIDKLDQIIIKNALLAGKKRYFIADKGSVDKKQFADTKNDFVDVSGNLSDMNIREIDVKPLDAFIANHRMTKIDEMKETSGNRDFNQGGTGGGVTAAAAIAALQESGNKGSRDMLKGSYRVYTNISYMSIELTRQFYDETRYFRIEGQAGEAQFVEFNNSAIKEQQLPEAFTGAEQSFRVPIFDIKVKPQKSNPFSRAAQNEFAKELYGMGMFNPQMADMALSALDMMDFEGKQKVVQRISQNGTMMQQMIQMQQTMSKMAQVLQTFGVDLGIPTETQGKPPSAPVGKVQANNPTYAEKTAANATPTV